MSKQAIKSYLAKLPPERREAIEAVRAVIRENIDEAFEETFQYGMPAWALPHSRYPAGYHCDPAQPLPFASIASQKKHIGLYLFCIYGNPGEEARFRQQWKKSGKRLDMGKSCIRFKSLDDVPLDVIGGVFKRMTADKFVKQYEAALAKTGTKSTAKKAAAKKTTAKKTTAKKATAKRATAKKATAKKATAKKTTAKKTTAKKATAKKPTAKKPTAKKTTAKKATAKKPTAKKPTAKKPTAKKPTAKKPTAKKPTAKKATAKKATPKKATAKKTTTRRATPKKAARRSAVRKRAAG